MRAALGGLLLLLSLDLGGLRLDLAYAAKEIRQLQLWSRLAGKADAETYQRGQENRELCPCLDFVGCIC